MRLQTEMGDEEENKKNNKVVEDRALRSLDYEYKRASSTKIEANSFLDDGLN